MEAVSSTAAAAAHGVASTASTVGASAVHAAQEVIIIYNYPKPPPPPLSTVVDNWVGLYLFLGLLGAYLLTMAAVFLSFRFPVGSPGEELPLRQKVTTGYMKRERSLGGSMAWQNADPAMVNQCATLALVHFAPRAHVVPLIVAPNAVASPTGTWPSTGGRARPSFGRCMQSSPLS